MRSLPSLVRALANKFGVEIVRKKDCPRLSFLGLKEIGFRSVVDVGANEGQFAGIASRAFPQATIYCFEPIPGPFNILSQWVKDTGSGNFVLHNVALGDSEGELELHLHEDHTPSSSLLRATPRNIELYKFMEHQSTIRVPIKRLDDVMADRMDSLAPEILIKMDVQGYEDRVIAGCPRLLGKARACIIEVNLEQLYEGQAAFATLVSRLADAGLTYGGNLSQVHGLDGSALYSDAVFLRRSGSGRLSGTER